MRKQILILSALLLSVINIAGSKEDLQKAFERYNQTQNSHTFRSDLLKVLSNKADDYTREAKLELAKSFAQSGQIDNAKRYLRELIADRGIDDSMLETAYNEIYQIERNAAEKLKISQKLVELSPGLQLYQLQNLKDYVATGNTRKADEIYRKITARLNKQERLDIDLALVNIYETDKLYSAIDDIVDKLLKDRDNTFRLAGKDIQISVATNARKFDDAIKYAREALLIAGNQKTRINETIYKLFIEKGDKRGALNHLIELNRKASSPILYQRIIIVAEELGDKATVDKYLKDYRASTKSKSRINLMIATRALESDTDGKVAVKYATKAVKEDKIKSANRTLAFAYVKTKNKTEALKAINQAVKDNVYEAKELRNYINATLK